MQAFADTLAGTATASQARRLSVANQDGGQVTVFGKGGKTRVVLLGADAWRELVALRGDARAGMPESLSAHRLRHVHARPTL